MVFRAVLLRAGDFRPVERDADFFVRGFATCSGLPLRLVEANSSSCFSLIALQAAELPVIEVHLSNIFRREPYRQHSYISQGAKGVICGLGAKGYELALEAIADLLAKSRRG